MSGEGAPLPSQYARISSSILPAERQHPRAARRTLQRARRRRLAAQWRTQPQGAGGVGSGLCPGLDAHGAAGGAGGRDDRDGRCSQGRADGETARLPVGVLRPDVGDAGRQAGAARSRAALSTRIARVGSQLICSSAPSARSGRWWRRWPRWTCMREQQRCSPTRKVEAITEELCGHRFSASSIRRDQQAAGHKPGPVRRPI